MSPTPQVSPPRPQLWRPRPSPLPGSGTHGPRCRTARISSARRRAARSPAPSPASRTAPGPRPPRTPPWARRAAGSSATRWGRRRRRCSSDRPPARTYGSRRQHLPRGRDRSRVPPRVPRSPLTAGPGPRRRAAATPWRPPSCRHRERRRGVTRGRGGRHCAAAGTRDWWAGKGAGLREGRDWVRVWRSLANWSVLREGGAH